MKGSSIFWFVLCFSLTAHEQTSATEGNVVLQQTIGELYPIGTDTGQVEQQLLYLSSRYFPSLNKDNVRFFRSEVQRPTRNRAALIHFFLGELAYSTLQDYSQAVQFYQQGLETDSSELSPNLRVRMLRRLVACFRHLGSYEGAVNQGIACIRLASELEDWYSYARCATGVATVYQEVFRQPANFIEYQQKAIEAYQKLEVQTKVRPKEHLLVLFYLVRGLLDLEDLSVLPQALAYNQKAFQVLGENPDADFQAQHTFLKGLIYERQGAVTQAFNYLLDALERFIQLKDRHRIAELYHHLGRWYTKQAEYEAGIQHGQRALALGQRYGLVDLLPRLHYELSTSYRSAEQYDEALVHYQRYTEINDSLLLLSNRQLLSESMAKGQLSDLKRENQQQEVRLHQQRLSVQRLLFTFLGLLTVGGAIAVWVLRRLKKANTKLQREKEQVEAQRAILREVSSLKSRFFSNISHELRTPLSLVLGPIRQLRRDQTIDPAQKRLLKLAERSGLELEQLLTEVLDFSRSENTEIPVFQDAVPLNQLLEQMIQPFKIFADQHQLKLSSFSEIGAETVLNLDRAKLIAILKNLLSNALKYTEPGGAVQLTVKQVQSQLLIAVADTGIGIAAKDLPRIFDRYYRSEKVEQSTTYGIGIGLSICKTYSELMGGRIEVTSTPGLGTTFQVFLPYRPIAREHFLQQRALPIDSPAILKSVEGASILVVDDDQRLRQYLAELLTPHHRVTLAANGKEALHKLAIADQPVELIICDLRMPILDGQRLVAYLKSKPEFAFVPIIVLTARTGTEEKIGALRTGVDYYLFKPFDPEELLLRIVSLLEKVGQRQAASESAETLPEGFTHEDYEWLRSLEEHVRSTLDDPSFNVGRLIESLPLTESSLRRRLRQLTGQTPGDYIRELRLTTARDYLRERRFRTIAQVARAVGFRDPDAFSRSYQRFFQRSPSEEIRIEGV